MAEPAIAAALRMLAETQERQSRLIMDLVGRQAYKRTHLVNLLAARDAEARTPPAAAAAGDLERPFAVSLQKMTPGDDIEAFLQVFKLAAEASGWPQEQWALRLLPLLTGEGLTTAHALPATTRAAYLQLRRALTDRLGLTEEGHRRRFQESQWVSGTRPFTLAHQMMDAVCRWLKPDERDTRQLMEEVVREGFVHALPPATAEWITCHWPTTLDAAINLAEDHMAIPPHPSNEDGQRPSPRPR